MSERRGLGYRPDPGTHLVTSSRHLLGAISETPPEASLESVTAPILDQGQTSSCVGFAIARAIHTTLAHAGIQSDFPSPQGIYGLAREIDRDDPDQPLRDEGCMPNQAWRAVDEWGVASLAHWPFEPAKINDESTFIELRAASGARLDGYYRIDDNGPDRVRRIRQAIAAGYAITIATYVDDAFYSYHGGTELLHGPFGHIYGGHYLTALSYQTTSDGTRLRFANSWGTGWGDRGFGVGDEQFIAKARDIYVACVKPAI